MAVNDQSTTDWGSLLGAGANAAINYYGNQKAVGALTGGEQNGINTQQGVQGQLGGIYGTQRGLGVGADVSLGQQLGVLGGKPDYAPFLNSPGYQFAVQQGDQAIQRTAAANGSLYTPNTLAMLSQYNTGYASQNYNNYIGQLMQAAGLGAQGNAGLASGITSTGANISQLQQNQGNANAGGAANASGIASNLLGKVNWGQVANGASNYFGHGSSTDANGNSYLTGNGDSGYDYSNMSSMYPTDTGGGTSQFTDPNTGGTTSYYGDDNSNFP